MNYDPPTVLIASAYAPFVFLIWFITIVTVTGIAVSRGGNAPIWILLSLIFGPLALPFAFFAGTPCPACGQRVSYWARMCNRCGAEYVAKTYCDGSGHQLFPTRTCPFCAERVKIDAIVCRHCGRDFPASEATPEAVTNYLSPADHV